jgi:tripartite-type tricarboxylate transporter receptor subunit TctC
VPIIIDTTLVLGAQIKAGKLRPLAVAYPKRSQLSRRAHRRGSRRARMGSRVVAGGVRARGYAEAIVQRLNAEIAGIMKTTDVQARLAELGVEVGGGPPEQLAEFQKAEIAKWSKVVKAAGVNRSDVDLDGD